MRKCWLNIHDPPPMDTVPNEIHNAVYLQDKGKHYIGQLSKGDIAFIYEKKTSPGRVIVEDSGGRSVLQLQEPRGGIVAVIGIVGDFVPDPHVWCGVDSPEKTHYLGHFEGEGADVTRAFVPLDEIKEAWAQTFNKQFNPRLNGGLRQLNPDECKLLKRLVGFRG